MNACLKFFQFLYACVYICIYICIVAHFGLQTLFSSTSVGGGVLCTTMDAILYRCPECHLDSSWGSSVILHVHLCVCMSVDLGAGGLKSMNVYI